MHPAQLHKRLVKEAALEQVNIWIEKAALRLDLPTVNIIEDAIPQGALSELESDTKAVSSVAIRALSLAALFCASASMTARCRSFSFGIGLCAPAGPVLCDPTYLSASWY